MTIEELEKYLYFQRKKYWVKLFFRKAKRIVADFIPLQEISKGNFFYHKIIRDELETQSFSPKTFQNNFSVIGSKLKRVEIFGLQNVFVTPDSTYFLTENLKQVYYEKITEFSKDYTLLYNTNNLLFHSHKLVKIKNLTKIKKNGEAFFLGGTFSFNYFHLLIELLPKFQFFDEIPNNNDVAIVTNELIEKNGNMKELLSFFSKNRQVEYLSPQNYYQYDKIWHITYPNYTVPNINEGEGYMPEFTRFSEESLKYVRKICMDHFDIDRVSIEPVSKIFLARKSEFRKYNEDELLETAVKYGFSPVYFEDLNIHEQIYLIQNSDYIIGPSGAAWTNLIFCEENKTKGLMWLGNVWKDFSVFSTLAEFTNFNLYSYRFDQKDATFHSDYYIDPKTFEEQLKKLLK